MLIGETLVEESKRHITPGKALDKIQEYLKSMNCKITIAKYSSKNAKKTTIEEVIEKLENEYKDAKHQYERNYEEYYEGEMIGLDLAIDLVNRLECK